MTEEKQVQVFPPPEEEPPDPTFLQYLVGWGLIFLGLVAVGALVGVLMKVLR